MGLFKFVGNAGKKLANKVGDIVGIGEANAAEAVQENIEQYNPSVEGLQTKIEGQKVIITGTVQDTAEMERIVLAAGNIQGVEEVESQIKVVGETPSPQAQFYTVKSGDTLSKIARDFYGNANRYNKIFEANRPMLSHPDKIYPGQSLRIPADEKSSAAA